MLTMTEVAAGKVKGLMEQQGVTEEGLRIRVVGGGCSGFSYALEFDNPKANDKVFEFGGVKLMTDPKSYIYLSGAEVDYVDGLSGSGFTLKNPNAKGTCGCGSSFYA
jgi:iron-sulfur cluster insertion protein